MLPYGLAFENIFSNDFPGRFGIYRIIFLHFSLGILFISSSVGVPNTSNITSI